ncbi:hypothetical protein D9M68_727190 [compost metagenome]
MDTVVQRGIFRQCREPAGELFAHRHPQVVEDRRDQGIHVGEVLVDGTQRHPGAFRQAQWRQRVTPFLFENPAPGLLQCTDQRDGARLARLLARTRRHLDMHEDIVVADLRFGPGPAHERSSSPHPGCLATTISALAPAGPHSFRGGSSCPRGEIRNPVPVRHPLKITFPLPINTLTAKSNPEVRPSARPYTRPISRASAPPASTTTTRPPRRNPP